MIVVRISPERVESIVFESETDMDEDRTLRAWMSFLRDAIDDLDLKLKVRAVLAQPRE